MARECVANRLRMLSRVITGLYEDEFRPIGLTVSQMIILVLTERRKELRAVEIARTLRMDASTVSRNLERMRSRGWLETLPREDDRSRPIRLTTSGRQVLREATLYWESAQAKAVSILGSEGVTVLRRVTDNLNSGEPADRGDRLPTEEDPKWDT
ncbi:MAG: MarR family winged helix-turn-helix transcriptional regulator [Myxococcales bacterium]|nr:MarR family winged helix-turn-helix transcriptional regulator [Myxococcales bacterium]